MYVLMKADSIVHLDCELLGTYDNYENAVGAMLDAWDDEVNQCVSDGFIDRDELEYACYVVGNFAQIARPHGLEAIKFYIFDTNEQKED